MFHPSGVRTWDRNYNEKKKEMKRVVLFTINHPRVKKIKEFLTFVLSLKNMLDLDRETLLIQKIHGIFVRFEHKILALPSLNGVRFEQKILAPTSLNAGVTSEVIIMCAYDGWACCIELHGYPEEKF
jgi:hypothetical protein